MHTLEALELYTQFHERWFESPARYIPGSEHLDALDGVIPASWPVAREGLWYAVTPPGISLPEHGWKLHVSASSAEAPAVLRAAAEVLRAEPAVFKFLLDRRITALSNGKLWHRGSSGKFITVYPASPPQFHELGRRLADALASVTGPYILSDRRWPGSSCVSYRYGGFTARAALQADGTRRHVLRCPDGSELFDTRVPYWNPPPWARDPLPEDADPPAPLLSHTLCDDRFVVQAALAFSNRGGVYRALDRRTGSTVVLKEARPGVEIGASQLDAVAVLEKEYRLLQRLAATGAFVLPIAFFRAWEHAFFAEEHVSGSHLGLLSLRHNPIYSGTASTQTLAAYFERMRALWLQLAHAIAAAHQLGIVLGDLSFTNILVSDDGALRICDLETAVEEGVDGPLGLHTPGMSAAGISARANDYYSLGALMLGSMLLIHGLTGFHPPLRAVFLAELERDLATPPELRALIDSLMTQPEHFATAPSLAAEAIQELPVTSPTSFRVPRLAGPLPDRFHASDRQELRARVQSAVTRIATYLHGTADPSRHDRLFPADLFVFETNPLSLAYGACGVLHALHRIERSVPPSFADWVLRHPVATDAYPPGLYLGQAGVAWVLADMGYLDQAVDLARAARHHPLLWDSAGILYGAAGYGLTCLHLYAMGSGDEFLDDAVRAGERLANTAVRDERGARWPWAGGIVPLGYAHGGSGIALFLLYLSMAAKDDAARCLGRAALRFELSHGEWIDGQFAGFPARVANNEESAPEAGALSCYWDVGSAGVGTALLRYARLCPEPDDEQWLATLAADTSRKYTAFPQLFRGLAGLGNFLLDLWLYSGDETHLLAAWQVAEGILLFGIDRPEGLAFPGDQVRRESADFATGAAGIALYLHRLLQTPYSKPGNFNFVLDELSSPPLAAH
ncbi:MAG: class III lanthionine synthetase LanKC [Bryobacteraceae bacterium]|nr:class III lanthionine synthetase LanKC [Bryobacteraceae bacterium]